jgi:hypothetical protein
MSNLNAVNLGEKIRQIYAVVAELTALFPGRKFTPDGHMVGSLGEAIAAIEYGVELYHSVGHPRVDGRVGGREVQIKTTQGTSVALKKQSSGDLLLVIKLNPDGTWERIYDGDAARPWGTLAGQEESGLREKTISLKRLQELQLEVAANDRIRRI